jgi:nucleoside-diphosphate-sugar epimerase
MNDSSDSLQSFRNVNVEGTLALARKSALARVKRFVFISSVKVNGEYTSPGRPFTPLDVPDPMDPYAISKYEAEQGLLEIAARSGMEVVIVRPVLVYGPGVGANFLSMMKWVRWRIPLPFGGVDNRRSLVSIDNLVDFIDVCLKHPSAANEIFLVSDNEDLSVSDLIRRINHSMKLRSMLINIPSGLMLKTANAFGMKNLGQRLLSSLQVDVEKNARMLGWQPPVNVDQALALTVSHFMGADQ